MGSRNRCKIAALLICNVIFRLLECRLFNKMNAIWLESIMAAGFGRLEFGRGSLECINVQVNQSSLQLKVMEFIPQSMATFLGGGQT